MCVVSSQINSAIISCIFLLPSWLFVWIVSCINLWNMWWNLWICSILPVLVAYKTAASCVSYDLNIWILLILQIHISSSSNATVVFTVLPLGLRWSLLTVANLLLIQYLWTVAFVSERIVDNSWEHLLKWVPRYWSCICNLLPALMWRILTCWIISSVLVCSGCFGSVSGSLPAVAPGLLKLIEEAFVQQKNWVFIFGGRFVKEEERISEEETTQKQCTSWHRHVWFMQCDWRNSYSPFMVGSGRIRVGLCK